MCDIYKELNAWQVGPSTHRLGALARRHLALYSVLRERRTDTDFWEFRPKHHMMVHCCENCVSNPKEGWNYRNESEIGTCANQSKHTNQAASETALIQRYRVTFEFEGSTP